MSGLTILRMKGATTELVRRLEAEAPVKVVHELSQRACDGDTEALTALVRYSRDGKLLGMRDFVVSSLAKTATPSAASLETSFREWLQPQYADGHRYWATLGLVNILGAAAYPELIAIASDESLRTDLRANAVKLLARDSGQSFDAGRPSDPGDWRIEDIEVARLNDWASSGYPTGTGYVLPVSDPALQSPVTRLELAAALLERRLQNQRQQRFDPANPSDMLIPASPEEIEAIKSRFGLPSNYLEFLERFSPLNVLVESRRFINGLQLFGVRDLVLAQAGYSFDSLTSDPITDWPGHMVVVASDGGDPYTLDLSHASESDAPVCTARHGEGAWKFKQVAPSFVEFMERLK